MSIAKVAERAGVSPATVSLVINNKSSVASSTAKAVKAIMEEIGYEPPPLARRQGRRAVRETSLRLGVLAMMPGNWLTSPVFGDVLHGLEAASRNNDASILLHHVEPDKASTLDSLRDKVDGLVLFGGCPRPENLGKLAALPCVRVMGSPDEDAWCDHVTYKNVSIGHLAARHLLSRKHQHVACLYLDSTGFMAERERIFTGIIEEAGGTVERLDAHGIIVPSDDGQTLDKSLLNRLMDQLLAATPRPTGLFLTADMAAPPVYLQLLQRGVQPGKEIEIVSCNNERSLLNGLEPRPSVVDIHAREVGRRAMEQLLWRIKHLKAPPADVLIHPTLNAARDQA